MNQWINLTALGQIVVVGLLCGAGLPALFAVGLWLLSDPRGRMRLAAAGEESSEVHAGPVTVAAAGLCFAIVLAAIGWGIYFIVAGS
ncbi:MAG: putative rane protein [Frankiales bacterium]|nr:putative rane protein [Frankiales bacterium]